MEGILFYSPELISANATAATHRIDLNQQTQGILGYRKAGTLFGGHYHEGKSSSKNPEKLTLVYGIMRMWAENIKSGEKETFLLRAPISVEIAAGIFHKLEAVSDVVFVEMNSLEDHAADTKYEM
ncbi:hypothetical protein GC194_12810 [bacterium]|nr:hypothetical protein [bacterium]